MTFDEFEASLSGDEPPATCSPYLAALWRDRRGDWHAAHQIVQELDDEQAALIHAYLHRKEGDESNARYWYRQAGQPFPLGQTLDQEWERLTSKLLAASG